MAFQPWPFVGRHDIAAEVRAALGEVRCVVLRGAPGLGKTSLANQIAADFAARGMKVRRIVASPASAAMPLAPFATFLDDQTGAGALNVVSDALTDSTGAFESLLVVDDLHHLDDASATIVHQLVVGQAVRLLITTRDDAVGPSAVQRVLHEPEVVTFDVRGLADTSILDAVEARLGGPLDAYTRTIVAQLADGNPLYARELIEGSLVAGALSEHGGVWTLSGEVVTSTPLLEEVVLLRLVGLVDAELAAMEMLTIGGALELSLLAGTVGESALEQLEGRELIRFATAAGELAVDVNHPLHREMLRTRLGVIARMRIYRTLAHASGPPSSQDSTPMTLRATVWHVRGGLDVETDILIGMASHALAAGDAALAAELSNRGFVDSGHADAALLASWCLAQDGRHEESVAVVRIASDSSTDPWERAALDIRLAEELWWTGHSNEATAVLDSAPLHEGPCRQLLDAQRSVFAMLDGDLDGARRRCAPLVDHPHLWVRFVAAVAIGNVAIAEDRCDEALALCGRVVSDAAEADLGLMGDASVHLAIQLTALLHNGDITAAHEFARAAYIQSADRPSLQVRAWTAMLAGRAGAFSGDVAETARMFAEAEQLWARNGLDGFGSWCAGGLARAQAELGAVDDAHGTLERLDRYDANGFGLYRSPISTARAWAAAGSGDRAATVAHLSEALAIARSSRAAGFEAWAWHETARLKLIGHLDGLDDWARPTGGLSVVRYDFVHALLTPTTDALAEAAARFESMGARLYAAEAFAQAAQVARRTGDTRNATRFDGRSGLLAESCGHPPTPLLAGRATVGPLSPREREIAVFAASGLSNRSIAEKLIVSERTVENHLYRVFIKLDVSSRDQLATALDGVSPLPGGA